MIEQGVAEALHRAQTSKDPKAIAHAEALASVLRVVKLDGFQDVSLTQTELSSDIRRFSDEEKRALAKEGLKAIHELTGETIEDQRKQGKPFWYVADSEHLLSVKSMLTEVAIDPRPQKFFLPKSNNATLNQLLEMVAEFSHKLQRRLKTESIQAVIGEAPDYTQLAFLHLAATGVRLYGKDYDFRYTGTKTPVVGSNVASVGLFVADVGLRVSYWPRGHGDSSVWVSPLVVPAGSK